MKLIILLAMFLVGCNGAIVKDVQLVKIPVAVPCVDQLPQAPTLRTDAELKALPDYQAVLALIQDRIKREIYESQLEAVLKGCQ